MLRKLIDDTTRFLAWIKRNRKIRTGGRTIKINLGCGLAVAPGWLNIDGSLNALFAKWPSVFIKVLYRLSGANKYYSYEEYHSILRKHVFVHHDLKYGIPFPDRSVDFVYSSHFIEHLFKEDAVLLFSEAFRVLKNDGIMRVCIPDLEFAMNLYNKGEKERMLDSYFFVDRKLGYFAHHKFMYDFELLEVLLKKAGFKNIKRYSCKKGGVPDIRLLDSSSEDTLFVEAAK